MVELQDFDMAEHLRSEEEIQLYLNEVLKEDDVDLILSALGDIAKARNMSQIAREAGVSREGLYKAFRVKVIRHFLRCLKSCVL